MTKALTFLLLLSLIGCQATAPVSAPTEGTTTPTDQPSTHGMLMVGDGPVYLSHLPMFHKPHDYQVLLEVALLKDGVDPTALYVQDRQVTGEKIYTVVPETFVLPELFAPAGQIRRTSFKATLVRGHFERGGQQFLSNVTVKVTRVVLAKKFAANPTALPNLQYFLFGDQTQMFAAHVINKKPDFDHVTAVRISSGVLTDAQANTLRAGAIVNFPSAVNDAEHALVEGQSFTGSVVLDGASVQVGLDVLTDFYLETGDLEL